MSQFKTVEQYRQDLQNAIPGASIRGSRVFSVLRTAFAALSLEIHPRTLIREVETTNPFATSLRRYLAPSDALRLLEVRKDDYYYVAAPVREMFTDKHTRQTQLTYLNGVPILEIDDPAFQTGDNRKFVHEMENLTGVTADGVLNLAIDKVNGLTNNGITFDLDKTVYTGGIVVTGLSVDISDMEEDDSVYISARFPNAQYIETATLTLTSGATTQTLTASGSQISPLFQNGINLIRFGLDENQGPLTTAPITGYTFHLTYNSDHVALADNIMGIVVDNIYIANTVPVTIKYQSNSPFYNADVGFVSTPVTENDVIYLEDDAYNILLWEGILIGSHNVQAEDGVFNNQSARGMLHGGGRDIGLYKKYKAQHPSEVVAATFTYYRPVRS